ncbi:hypothetical protein [Acidianus brierleyi]|uniref:hypothetical protein n=1 Tax=Acidianus brierleyi TaxID=41673 RepID=UPI001FEA6EEE|nr:hypothetical protein [Acidianus brierleyi]
MGLIRRRENEETYFYWYEHGKKVYLGKLVDRTVIDKIKYISPNLDKLSEEERKEFLEWIGELKAVLGLIPQSMPSNDLDVINKKLDKVVQLLDGIGSKEDKRKSPTELDRAYEMMKNSLGYVRIDDLRRQLGMSLEQFMSEFRDYILENYELISGGKEGIIKDGTVYGIIRRKKIEKTEKFNPSLFDKMYNKVKNPMDIAALKDIREMMGLSKEEFYSTYSSYIESHYEMFRGGEEGIVKNGTIFGIIKR